MACKMVSNETSYHFMQVFQQVNYNNNDVLDQLLRIKDALLDANKEFCILDELPYNLDLYRKLFETEEQKRKNHIRNLHDHILELEEKNKILEQKCLTPKETEADKVFYKLEEKVKQYEIEKRNWGKRLQQQIAEYNDNIDRIGTKLRHLSLAYTETECLYRPVKSKFPVLEQDIAKNAEMIEHLYYRYNDDCYDKIKEMEKKIMDMEGVIKELQNKVDKFKEVKRNVGNQLDVISQAFSININEYEAKIKDIKEKHEILIQLNEKSQEELNDLRLEETDVDIFYKKNAEKLEKKIAAMVEHINVRQNENHQAECENSELRKQFKKLKLKWVVVKPSQIC